jgi:predicted dehydrogenase
VIEEDAMASTRREFMKVAGAGIAGAALAPTASSYANIVGANDRVRIGVVGFSDRFRQALLPSFLQHKDKLNFEIVAVSDIWSRRRDEAAAEIEKRTGTRPALARNNDELHDRKDVDAVFIATADFQHALHGVEAVRAGRDAYIEKPLANTMADAKAIRQAVKDTGRIVQIGSQRRSSEKYQRAYDFIKSGQFGDIVMAEMTWNVNQPGRWRRPALLPLLREQDTDWTRFLLNRPVVPFDPRKHLEFRLFWPYSSGIPCQWMCHQIDTVHWFTGLPRPRSVVANGGNYMWHDGRTNWDTGTFVFDYGPLDDMSKGFQVTYMSRFSNQMGGEQEIYHSNGGTLYLDTGKVTADGGLTAKFADEMNMHPNLLAERSLVQRVEKTATGANTGADEMTSANVRNWMECVRSRKTPNAHIDAGYSHSIALCMAIAAMHTGRKATFDDARQEVVVSGGDTRTTNEQARQ